MKPNSIFDKPKDECCGCASCRDICPKDAITMQPDAEGFQYPTVDADKCVDCGLCKKKCPTYAENLKGQCLVIDTYCGKYMDPQKVRLASSGGLCDAVASLMIDEGGVVYGAGYSDDFHSVVVKRIDSKDHLDLIRGSKYVQSIKPTGLYQDIKRDLNDGRRVLFIGLPCDVAAVKNQVGSFDNLITIEIICSGVPSPEIHNQFASHIETITGKKITSFTYRKKQHGWHWPYVEAKNGESVIYNKSWSAMELGYAFMTLVRPSCYTCKYKGENNLADITAGDFWGLKKTDQRYYSNGVSAIIVRSKKGKEMVERLKDFELQKASYDEIRSGNPRLYSCPKPRRNRKHFSDLFIKKGLVQAYKDSLTVKDYLRNIIMTVYSILNLR